MPYEDSAYRGDKEYRIDCTNDVYEGDEIRFNHTLFIGSRNKPQSAEFCQITGTVLNVSYGAKPHCHTFTLRLPDNTTMPFKERNLYANECWRKPSPDETQRSPR